MGRKEKKYHFIYKTTNLLSGKYYYGMHSTDNLEDGYMGSGRRLRYSLNKYGKDNHKREIIEFVDSRNQLIKREEEIVNLNEIAKEDCLNLRVGGSGGFKDDEHRKKFINSKNMVLAKRNSETTQKRLIKGDPLWNETRLKNISAGLKLNKTITQGTFLGKKHSEESKKKMSESMKGKYNGKNNPSYGTCWVTRSGENRKIKKEKLFEYVSQGWTRGRDYSNK